MAKHSLAELRQLIGTIDGSRPKHRRAFSKLPPGLPVGCLVEFSGQGKTELLSQFLKEHPELQTAWIEPTLSINPYALWQRGVDVSKILFIEGGKASVWAAHQVLQSQAFELLTLSGLRLDERELRRLQLLTEKCESHLILLSPEPLKSWALALQIEVQQTSAVSTFRILRNRGAA